MLALTIISTALLLCVLMVIIGFYVTMLLWDGVNLLQTLLVLVVALALSFPIVAIWILYTHISI